MQTIKRSERLLYPDFLRIIAAFAVVFIHTISNFWFTTKPQNSEWLYLEIGDSLLRFSVPIFVMISGLFMLDPNRSKSLKDLYTKNIFRIFTSYIFWSWIYVVFKFFFTETYDKYSGIALVKVWIRNLAYGGDYHLWYLPMLLGLYIATPIFRKITENKNLLQYFLLLWFVFTLCVNFGKSIEPLKAFSDLSKIFKFSVALEYSGYYCLGYYLHNLKLSKKQTHLLYILGALSLILTNFLTIHFSANQEKGMTVFFNYLSPFTAFYTIGIFVFFKNIFENHTFSEKTSNLITKVSKYTFGSYLSHLIFVRLFFKYLSPTGMPTICEAFLAAIAVFVISTAVSAVINKIPFLNKYIV